MNKFIEKINFKKVVIAYVLLLVLMLILILLFLGNIYKDKINTIYNYHKLAEAFEGRNNTRDLKSKINNLGSSKDIVDVVILDNENIIYKESNFYKNTLKNFNNSNKYYTDSKGNIYKLENTKEFVLDLLNVKEDDEDDYYDNFQINVNKNNSYVINYLKNDSNQKVIIISKSNIVKTGKETLKISLSIIALFFMMYWVITALMIYQNALKLNKNAYFWGVITLLTNIIGVIIYLIYVKNTHTCSKCRTSISVKDKYCKGCGRKI